MKTLLENIFLAVRELSRKITDVEIHFESNKILFRYRGELYSLVLKKEE